MYEAEFFKFLSNWNKAGRFPGRDVWPATITFGTKFWSRISRLASLTKQDNHEYESTFFYVNDNVNSTEPVKGNEYNVQVSHKIDLDYDPRSTRLEILVDNRRIDSLNVRADRLKDQHIGFLTHMHTHPHDTSSSGAKFYSFFSDADLNSLLSSNMFMTGLVIDRLWLCCKTDRAVGSVGQVGLESLYKINDKLFLEENALDDLVRKEMQNWGLVFYSGQFDRALNKLTT